MGNNQDFTVDKLIEFLEGISKEGKGNYKIVNGGYDLVLTSESFEIDNNKDQPCVVVW